MMMGNRNGNAGDYWNESAFSYKFCCLTSTAIFMLGILIPAILVLCIDVPQLTIWSFQVWRLLVSMWGQFPSIMSILSIAFSFMWLHAILKDAEGSTIYKIFQIMLINLEIHLVFNLISLLFTLIFETKQSTIFFGYGWFPIIIIYQFRNSIIDPEAERRFCCLPFLIKSKYFPWVILILLSLLSTQFFCFLASGIVGYFQEVVRKDMFIKLPYGFYTKVESWLPYSIKNRPDFVSIDKCDALLRSKCYGGTVSSSGSGNQQPRNEDQNAREYPNPFSGSGVKMSGGATIGGNSVSDFRNYWAKKQQPQQNSKTTNQAEIEIEPQMHYANQQIHQNQPEDNSYAKLSQDSPQNQGLLEESKEKKKEKNEELQHSDLI